MDDAGPLSIEHDRRPHAWATTFVVLLWLGLHVAGLVATGGRLESDHVFTWAGVPPEQLVKHGALVPTRVDLGEVQRLLTGAVVVGQGALSLVLALWIFVGSSRAVERLTGTSRVWIAMTVATLAGALVRVAYLPEGRLPHMAGWDLVLGLVGARIPLGLAIGGPPGRTMVSSAFAFLALTALLGYAMPGTPTSHYLGEGAGFVAGALTFVVLGPRRSLRPAGGATRGFAWLCFALVVAAAGWQVKTTLGAGDPADVRRVLRAVAAADYAGQEYAKRSPTTTREALRQKLEAAREASEVSGLEGAAELDLYLDLMGSLLSAESADPASLRSRLRAAYLAWKPFEDRLARANGGDTRIVLPWR